MDSTDVKLLLEAYSAVYDEELRDEFEELNELDEDLSFIDELSDEELDLVVEDIVYDLLDEGYELDDVEYLLECVADEQHSLYEQILLELNPYAPAGSKEARQYAKYTTASKRGAERAERFGKAVGKVRRKIGDVISGIRRAGRSALTSVVDRPAAGYATRRGLIPKKTGEGAYKTSDWVQNYVQSTPAGRRQVRGAVARDVASRVRGKIQRGAARVGSQIERGATRVGSQIERGATRVGSQIQRGAARVSAAPGIASRAAQSAASGAKRGVKGLIGRAASGVARRATSLAQKMQTESYDFYDVVLEHLIYEGYADNVEDAEMIMANMSEEWIQDIVEVTGGGHISPSGTTYSGYRSPAQKRYDQTRLTSYEPGEGTIARLARGRKEAGIRSSYAVGSREEVPTRNPFGGARSPEGTESGLSMSPTTRAAHAANRAERTGQGKRASKIRRLMNLPPSS